MPLPSEKSRLSTIVFPKIMSCQQFPFLWHGNVFGCHGNSFQQENSVMASLSTVVVELFCRSFSSTNFGVELIRIRLCVEVHGCMISTTMPSAITTNALHVFLTRIPSKMNTNNHIGSCWLSYSWHADHGKNHDNHFASHTNTLHLHRIYHITCILYKNKLDVSNIFATICGL